MRFRKTIMTILLAVTIGAAHLSVPVYAIVPPNDVTQEGQGSDPQPPVIEGENAIDTMPESTPATRGEELEKDRDDSTEEETESTGEALTPDGNLTLVDDIGSPQHEGKQFITVVTKNGNYFYLVIDRDDKGENTVHFLNQVDEEDLFSLLDEEDAEELRNKLVGDKEQDEIQTIITPFEPSPTPIPTEEPEIVVKEKDSKGVLIGVIFLIVLLGAVGAFVVIMLRKKKAEEEKPDPDADYHDEEDDFYMRDSEDDSYDDGFSEEE